MSPEIISSPGDMTPGFSDIFMAAGKHIHTEHFHTADLLFLATRDLIHYMQSQTTHTAGHPTGLDWIRWGEYSERSSYR